jgi:precorrin-2/cobalt-factor-2 C20-methyltransferase
MRDDNKKRAKLYGIGIGPGDPKLLTLGAKEILDRVPTIFVPKSKLTKNSLARAIVEEVILGPKDFIELTFPMTNDKKVLKDSWQKAARIIAKKTKEKKETAFVTLGDPLIFSTYIYLLKILSQDFPDLDLETIPGISSFGAAASRLGLPLVEGNQKLAILPLAKDLKGLRETLNKFDTTVLMKVASKLDKVIGLLKEMKLIKNSVLITHAGHSNERIIRDLSSIKDKKLGYLSVIIVKRNNTGG